MTLVSLPAENLALICSLLDFPSIGRLYLCGCASLCVKLGSGGGVRDVNFEVTRTHQLVWPNLLRKEISNVETLRIVSMASLSRDSVDASCLHLPRIRELTLHFGNALELFPGPWHVNRNFPINFDSPVSLPNLQLLDIESSESIRVDAFFAYLPQTLQILVLQGRQSVSLAALNVLPRSLTKLHLLCGLTLDRQNFEAEQVDIVVSLPESLTDVHLDEIPQPFQKSLFSGALLQLPNLEHLVVYTSQAVEDTEALKVLAQRPLSTLRGRFAWAEVDAAFWPLFVPQSLTSFSISFEFSNEEDDERIEALLAALPRTLKALEISFHHPPQNWLKLLPPSLESLIVETLERISVDDDIIQLPNSLTFLEATSLVLKQGQTFSCENLASLCVLSLYMPHCLPHSLTSLQISAIRTVPYGLTNANADAERERFSDLKKLRRLVILRSSWCSLPNKSMAIDDPSPFPEDLEDLHIASSSRSDPKFRPPLEDLIPFALPSRLTSLTLDSRTIEEETMKRVLQPMETLRRLSIPAGAGDANSLFYLPSRLLALTYRAEHICDDHISSLPRCLEQLILYSTGKLTLNVERDDLASIFPPMLWHLSIPKTDIFPENSNEEASKYAYVLPRHLRIFTAVWKRPDWWHPME